MELIQWIGIDNIEHGLARGGRVGKWVEKYLDKMVNVILLRNQKSGILMDELPWGIFKQLEGLGPWGFNLET